MIDKRRAKAYCCEDISLIENYDKAIADEAQTWNCHHRGEVLPCGVFSPADLQKFGLYWYRPACELIFLTKAEHNKLHNTNSKDETRKKKSASMIGNTNGVGFKQSEEARKRISQALKGHVGYWLGKESPWKSHRHTKEAKEKNAAAHIGRRWYNNGEISKLTYECPEGFVPGRIYYRCN